MTTSAETPLDSHRAHEAFVQLIIGSQNRLSAYIMSLVADKALADDILQETNLRLLRQESQFEPGTDFVAWAISIAYFQILTSRKQVQREKLRFDDELVQLLAHESEERSSFVESRMAALHHCLEGLDAEQRATVRARYEGKSVQELAAESSRPAKAVSQILYRARKFLAECVRHKLKLGEEGR